MTVQTYRQQYTASAGLFEEALTLVERSGAADLIDSAATAARGPGGRRPQGATYTAVALLVALYVRTDIGQVATISGIHSTILRGLTSSQQRRLDLDPEALRRDAETASYQRFYSWVRTLLAPMDAHAHQPARRVRVTERRERDAALSPQERDALDQAQHLTDQIVDAIVAASILDQLPDMYEGDVVVDETTIRTSKRGPGQGVRDEDRAPASPGAVVYARSRGVVDDSGTTVGHTTTETGCGVGVTAVARVGPPGRMRAMTPLVTAITIRGVTSGTPEYVGRALEAHRNAGFDPRTTRRRAKNSRQPYLIADMGYNVKRSWSSMLLQHHYDPVVRYPETWTRRRPTQRPGGPSTEHPGGPGPIMIEGALYCPYAAHLPAQSLAVRYESVLSSGSVAEHDALIRARHDLLMGTNGRLKVARPPGRPRSDTPAPTRVTLPVVCPADQGRVRCPLRPESQRVDPADAVTITPDWDADHFECCSRMHTTITLTDDQARDCQPLPGGSWEHMLTFEAYRARTEALFSRAKNRSMGGITSLNEGPRRNPWLALTIAIGFAVTNMRAQAGRDTDAVEAGDTITERWKELQMTLGYAPAKLPPRT